MYDWKFDEKTGGIFTGRYDMFGVEIYEGNKVETPLGIGIVRYNPNIGDLRLPKRMNR